MACDVVTITTGVASNGYYGLEDRSVLLAMAGALSIATGLTAGQAMSGAAAQGYFSLEDKSLWESILSVLCPSETPAYTGATVLVYDGGGAYHWTYDFATNPDHWILKIWSISSGGWDGYSLPVGSSRSGIDIIDNGQFTIYPAAFDDEQINPTSNEIVVSDR